MNSSSIEKYEKVVKKFATKFKHYRMPKGDRLLKYKVELWNKKIKDTKEDLASDVNENKNVPTVTTRGQNYLKKLML